jgi:uncharacterized RDD family membrane protein YckC
MQWPSDAWYIGWAGASHGPFPLAALIQAASEGKLPRETLVWTPGMSDWLKAGEVPDLFAPAASPQLPVVAGTDGIGSQWKASTSELTAHKGLVSAGALEERPTWRRFFARMIDFWASLISTVFLASVALGLLSQQAGIWLQNPSNATLFVYISLPIAFLVDALVVALFGNSLGKTVFDLRVRTNNGDSPNLVAYFKRNFSVLWYGFAASVPFVMIVTMIFQARSISKNGTTGYDKGRFRVESRKLSAIRLACAGGLVAAFFAGIIYLNVVDRSERHAYQSGHRWRNPETLRMVEVPPGWISRSQDNEQGQPIYVFTYPRENLTVVFGMEDVRKGMNTGAYAEAFSNAVKGAMSLELPGTLGTLDGRNSWNTSGYLTADATQRVSITIVQRENQMWRTVAVRLKGMTPDTDSYHQLRGRLFASL